MIEIQDACFRVVTSGGDVVRVIRIERDDHGSLYVRTPNGRRYREDEIISILGGDDDVA